METYPELWPSNTYEVISIEYGNYRIVDDVGEPILFNQRAFSVTDPTPTLDWVSIDPHHVMPSDWLSARGMMARFFDDDPDARRRFRSYMHRLIRKSSPCPVVTGAGVA